MPGSDVLLVTNFFSFTILVASAQKEKKNPKHLAVKEFSFMCIG